MKIRLDENVSYRVAGAVKSLTANRQGFDVSHVRDDNPPSTSDPNWIAKFTSDDGTAIVSGDYDILQHWPNLVVYSESGLISFFPPSEFKRLKGYGRAALLIRWWPAIIEKIKQSNAGNIWRIPMSWTPDITKFQPIKDPRVDAAKKDGRIKPVGKVYQFRSKT